MVINNAQFSYSRTNRLSTQLLSQVWPTLLFPVIWHGFTSFIIRSMRLILNMSSDPMCTQHNQFCSLFAHTFNMPDTGSVIILSIHMQCRGTEFESLAVVELFVELVRDLAVLASSPGPRSARLVTQMGSVILQTPTTQPHLTLELASWPNNWTHPRAFSFHSHHLPIACLGVCGHSESTAILVSRPAGMVRTGGGSTLNVEHYNPADLI